MEVGGRRRSLVASSPAAPEIDPFDGSFGTDIYPGRWDSRRGLPPELEPLPLVAGRVLEAAGWWRRGSGEPCPGGLVVGCDGGPLIAAARFVRELREQGVVPPSGFLFSLPSTATSVLGLLFGLGDYQATVVQGALSGVQALRHALDLLTLERLDRALVGVLSVAGRAQLAALSHSDVTDIDEVRLAAAVCLERIDQPNEGPAVAIGCEAVERGSEVGFHASVPEAFRHLAAAPLVELAHWLARSPETRGRIDHEDRFLGEGASISLSRR